MIFGFGHTFVWLAEAVCFSAGCFLSIFPFTFFYYPACLSFVTSSTCFFACDEERHIHSKYVTHFIKFFSGYKKILILCNSYAVYKNVTYQSLRKIIRNNIPFCHPWFLFCWSLVSSVRYLNCWQVFQNYTNYCLEQKYHPDI